MHGMVSAALTCLVAEYELVDVIAQASTELQTSLRIETERKEQPKQNQNRERNTPNFRKSFVQLGIFTPSFPQYPGSHLPINPLH
jgi:hypothetical protein